MERLKELAGKEGFDAVGVVPVGLLAEETDRLRAWVAEGKHAGMAYMARNMEVRENPQLLVEGARSVIVTLTGYYQEAPFPEKAPVIARYAWGKDYHPVIRERLYRLLEQVRQEEGEVQGRCFVDSAPVLERVWARRAGLGWQGKNTLLIRKGLGSFCFIGVIISTLELEEYDRPFPREYCGTCTRCVDACPTGALTPYEVDARKCIAYHTIENKGEYPEAVKRRAGRRIFGCDICQEVCPWNRHLPLQQIPEFRPSEAFLHLTREQWERMDASDFKRLFRHTPLERTGLARLLRNL